jgi:hypothetical protein
MPLTIRWRHAMPSLVIMLALAMVPQPGAGEIVWSGDYETGDFLQWHRPDDRNTAMLSGIPPHGRPRKVSGESNNMPAGYYGNGSLLEIVTHPVRQGRYAAKFTVRNSKNGKEPDDCDAGESICSRRRTELLVHHTLPRFYNAIPYESERWLSVSHYIPGDWERGGRGFGPHVFQIKPHNDRYTDGSGGLGPCLSIQIKDDGWLINHRWSNTKDVVPVPQAQRAEYTSRFPSSGGGDGGEDLRADFPDQQASQAALANLNKGGWTDWVMHVKFDARGAREGGRGFLTVWKRAGDEDWVQVLHIEPRTIHRDGRTYDRGICYRAPAKGSNPGGFGIQAGMYMDKNQVWGLSRNRVIINDNIKVGSGHATFEHMSPDGSSPSRQDGRPRPPKLVIQSASQNY